MLESRNWILLVSGRIRDNWIERNKNLQNNKLNIKFYDNIVCRLTSFINVNLMTMFFIWFQKSVEEKGEREEYRAQSPLSFSCPVYKFQTGRRTDKGRRVTESSYFRRFR